MPLPTPMTGGSPHMVASLVTFDAPTHPKYRKLTQEWFMPKNLRGVEEEIRALAEKTVDRLVEAGPEVDFVPLVSAPYPLHVVMQIMGVPEEDEPRMLTLTQQMFGGNEEDLNQSGMKDLPPEAITQLVAGAVKDLIATAKASGAETISLIPRNDGTALGNGERQANLRIALKGVLPLLRDAEIVALVEPLGFRRSSLRSKTELVETITSIGGQDQFKIVHDTFHHTLADGGPIYPEKTGIVHISAVDDPKLGLAQMEDEHRVLVDENDRLGNVAQIAELLAAGYDGAISYECFSPKTHALDDPYVEIKRSFDFISSQLQAHAA